MHWPQPLEDEAYLIRWALTLTPSSRLDWQGIVIFASRRRRTVCFAVSRPHSTRANACDRHTRNEHTHRLSRSPALCLSNPASKGRRWRRDASRAAILRLSQSFLTFVAAQHSPFLHPLHKHNTKQQQPNFRCCRHSFASVFSCNKDL